MPESQIETGKDFFGSPPQPRGQIVAMAVIQFHFLCGSRRKCLA